MEFSPNNKVVKLCLQGMMKEEAGAADGAGALFLQAWRAAADDMERYIAAYHVARSQPSSSDQLPWLETALRHARRIDDPAALSALPTLHENLAACLNALGDAGGARKNRELAAACRAAPLEQGPFYHGTKADLRIGDLLTAGGDSNYQPGLKMNHIYFTALAAGAGLAAAMARGEGRERVYVVQPTGPFENDPNVTDKRFPGNPTRSYRSAAPLRVLGEVADWTRQTPEDLRRWRDRVAKNNGEIIN